MSEKLSDRQKLMKALKKGNLNDASTILMRAEDAFYRSESSGEFTEVIGDIWRRHPRLAGILREAMDLGEVGQFDHRRNTIPPQEEQE